MFPLYVRRQPDDPPPTEPFAYVVGRGGVYIQKRSLAFRAVVPATGLPMLAEVAEGAECLLPPIPPAVTSRAIAFFRQVYAAYRSEAVLLLSYHPRRQTFRFDAPLQEVSDWRCGYEMPREAADGFTFVGTIHSHGSLGAGHSSIDHGDESKFDGLHCTFGRFDRTEGVDIAASLVVSGRRFKQDPERIFAGLRRLVAHRDVSVPPVHDSLEAIIIRHAMSAMLVTRFPARVWQSISGRRRRATARTDQYVPPTEDIGYVVDVPSEVPPEEREPDPTWMANVREFPRPTIERQPRGMVGTYFRWDKSHRQYVPVVPAGWDANEWFGIDPDDQFENTGEQPGPDTPALPPSVATRAADHPDDPVEFPRLGRMLDDLEAQRPGSSSAQIGLDGRNNPVVLQEQPAECGDGEHPCE